MVWFLIWFVCFNDAKTLSVLPFLDSYLFSNERERARKNIDLRGWEGGEDLGGVGGGEIIVRICRMKKINFQFKKQFLT